MSIHQLNSDNFTVVGRRSKTLNINIGGPVLVFFKMQGCGGCAAFEPIFGQLALQDVRVSYAIVDLTRARDVITKSRDTSTPIQTVPFIMLYVDGRPHAKYNGKKTISSIKSFIARALHQQAPPSSSSFMRGGSSLYGGGRGGPTSGHAGYAHQRPDEKVWMPDVKQPNLKGVIKGGGGYARLGEVDEEDDDKLLVPAQVIPHNTPWEMSDYASIGGE